jgi:hypothetical protein
VSASSSSSPNRKKISSNQKEVSDQRRLTVESGSRVNRSGEEDDGGDGSTPRAGQLAQRIAETGRRFLNYDMFGER